MFKNLKVLTIAAAALAAVSFAGTASAATVSCGNATVTETASTISDCATPPSSESSPLSFDGMTFQIGIRDTGSPAAGSPLSWATDPMSTELGVGLRAWGITLAADWVGRVVLELKQARTIGLFDVTSSCDFTANTCSGTWTTSGPGGSSNDLSHTRAWYKTTTPPVTTIPLPAAGWLLLAAMGGLGLAKRRKS